MKIKAPAKINLFLHVGPRLASGYHPIVSLMDKISLYDILFLSRREAAGVAVGGSSIPGENTIEKAARLLAAKIGRQPAASMELEKTIPIAAGLGGGSSDAAAALRLLVSEFGIDISDGELHALALEVGADVPFFLEPGACLAEGIGERLTAVELRFEYAAVVVASAKPLSTAQVYRRFDEIGSGRPFPERAIRARESIKHLDSLSSLVKWLHNDLEPAAFSLVPEIPQIKRDLMDAGASGALMSGSGPTVFGLFASKSEASAAAAALSQDHPRVWAVTPVST